MQVMVLLLEHHPCPWQKFQFCSVSESEPGTMVKIQPQTLSCQVWNCITECASFHQEWTLGPLLLLQTYSVLPLTWLLDLFLHSVFSRLGPQCSIYSVPAFTRASDHLLYPVDKVWHETTKQDLYCSWPLVCARVLILPNLLSFQFHVHS